MKLLLTLIFISVCILEGCVKPPRLSQPGYLVGGKRLDTDQNFVSEFNKNIKDKRVKLIEGRLPRYTPEIENRLIEGKVGVVFDVNEKGLVENVVVAESPDEALSQLSIQAIKSWRFEPIMINGVPRKVQMTQVFPFFLE